MLRLRGRDFPAQDGVVMAIVNRTPDSFYDRGATWQDAAAMARVEQVVAQGADIVDIGGVKAAPGVEVDAAEEIRRVVSFVSEVRASFPEVIISVDTYRSSVAHAVATAGADVLNDAWGGWGIREWPRWLRSSAWAWCAHMPVG